MAEPTTKETLVAKLRAGGPASLTEEEAREARILIDGIGQLDAKINKLSREMAGSDARIKSAKAREEEAITEIDRQRRSLRDSAALAVLSTGKTVEESFKVADEFIMKRQASRA